MPRANATGEGGTPVEGVDSSGQPIQPAEQPQEPVMQPDEAQASAEEQAAHLRDLGVFAPNDGGQ